MVGLVDILEQIGFYREEVDVYQELFRMGPLTATKLHALLPTIKKGLLYKTLDRLVEKGVIERDDRVQASTLFSPCPPDVIINLITAQEKAIHETRTLLDQLTPELHAQYIRTTHRPLVRHYDGKEGLRQVYEDTLESGTQELLVIRPATKPDSEAYFGRWFSEYQKRRIAKKVRIVGITPGENGIVDTKKDHENLYERISIKPSDYTSQTEIRVYGNKIAFISYGKELFALVIEHEDFTHALRDIYACARRGIES